MTIVGPTVPFHTDANGVLSAVYDPVNQALRISDGGGGGTGALKGYTFIASGSVTQTQVKRVYPTASALTILRSHTGRWPQIELIDLTTFGASKYYAQLTARLSVTDTATPRTMYAAMFQVVQAPGASTNTASGVGWTDTQPTWTVNTAGAVLSSSDPPGGLNTEQTPILELDLFTAHPTFIGKVGWAVWTDDPGQAFISPGNIAVYAK